MAEPQPNNVTEGADVEDDVQVTAKSAEDRKAAAAMAKLDAAQNDEGSATKEVDQEAMSKAMGALAGAKQEEKKKDAKKAVKLDQAELAFVMDQLDMSKPKATELLKAHDGDVMEAMRTVVRNPFKNFH